MTRGQRRAHSVVWIVLAVVLALASAHALTVRRAAWADTEATRDSDEASP